MKKVGNNLIHLNMNALDQSKTKHPWLLMSTDY